MNVKNIRKVDKQGVEPKQEAISIYRSLLIRLRNDKKVQASSK